MAVRRSYNALNQVRVSVPDIRGIESAIRSDFDELLGGLITGAGKPYVVRGFEIEMAGSIGSSANALQVIVERSSILHNASATAGTFFVVPAGTPSQTLSSTINPKVTGSFTPGSINYVGIDYSRQVANSTAIQRYFWSPATKSEFVKTAPQAELLDYKLVISTSPFSATPNVMPLAVIETDGANNVLSVEDRRPMLFRLGTAGVGSPDPTYQYGWNNHSEGRSENPSSSSSSSVSPFRGGDKQILSMKEMFDALMTEIKLIKGTPFWYSVSAGGSIYRLRTDLANTIITSKGTVTHDADLAGRMNWSQDIELVVVGSRIRYKILANPTSNNVILQDRQVAYLNLTRDISITPNLVFTNGSPVVTSVGSVPWTSGLVEGDYIKDARGTEDSYYQIINVDSPSQVTLAENFAETSTGISGMKAQYTLGVYEAVPSPSSNRHIKIDDIKNVTINQDNYWLFVRQDGSTIGAEQTLISTIDDVGGSLNNKIFKLSSNDNLRTFYFMFDNGFAVDPAYPGEYLVRIPLQDNSDSFQLAELVADMIDQQSDFSASFSGNQITVINELDGATAKGIDVDTGFGFSYIFAGAKAKVYARFFGSEVEQGETRQVSDNENYEIINYIGSRSEVDSFPSYSSAFEKVSALSAKFTFPSAISIPNSASFILFSDTDEFVFRPWFNINGAGTAPSTIDEILVEIPILSSFNPEQVALAVFNQLSTYPQFNISNNNDGSLTITLSEGGRTSTPANVDVAGMTIEIITYGSGEKNYYVQDGENLTQSIKRLDVSIQRILKAIQNVAYDEEYEVVSVVSGLNEIIATPAGVDIVIPLNSKRNFASSPYVVGNNQLEVFLNGLYLTKGKDWYEVGAFGENSVTITPDFDLAVGDRLHFRIDTGVVGPIFAGIDGGGSAGTVYDRSYEVVITPSVAEEIAGPIPAGTPISLPLGKTFIGDELQVYVNGIFMEEPQDYIGVSSSQIELNRDLNLGDLIRFRIEEGGGITSSGGGSGGGGLQINSGEVNTASNTGNVGAGIFKTKVGVDLQFKKLVEGPGITLFENPNNITISAAPTAPIRNVRTVTGVNSIASISDDYIRVINNSTDVTITLPPATTAGKEITLKKIDSGNVLSIATSGGETIDGVNATLTPLLVLSQYESVTLIANGTGWEII